MGSFGQHVVGRAPRQTCGGRRLQDAATAGEVSAAMLEDPASQVRLELVDDELGQAASVLGSPNEQHYICPGLKLRVARWIR
jgi:hypothetical protein